MRVGQPWGIGAAAAAYIALTIIATWPLAAGIARDVAWDLGDPVLVMWILSWDCEQLLRILGGDLSRVATFFDGNISYPPPLTLPVPHHLSPRPIQPLPACLLPANPPLPSTLLSPPPSRRSGPGRPRPARAPAG